MFKFNIAFVTKEPSRWWPAFDGSFRHFTEVLIKSKNPLNILITITDVSFPSSNNEQFTHPPCFFLRSLFLTFVCDDFIHNFIFICCLHVVRKFTQLHTSKHRVRTLPYNTLPNYHHYYNVISTNL